MRRTRLVVVMVGVAVAATLVPAPPGTASHPPPNDDFADATVIGALPFADAHHTAAATVEPGEPQPSCLTELGHTVWYRYAPARDQDLLVSGLGNARKTVVAIYTGTSLGQLTQVACMDGDGISTRDASQRFTFRAGTTYKLQVYGWSEPAPDPDEVVAFHLGRGGELQVSVTAAATGEPLNGICVHVFDADNPDGDAYGHEYATGNSGTVTQPVHAGRHVVELFDCDNQGVPPEPPTYVREWYDDAPTRAGATVLTIGDGDAVAIAEDLVVGGRITGTVNTNDGGDPSGLCVEAYRDGELASWAYPSGPMYTVTGLSTGDYLVRFGDCGHDGRYLTEWYDDVEADVDATPVHVDVGDTTAGIDAELALGGSIAGALTSASGDADVATCVVVFAATGTEVDRSCGQQPTYAIHQLRTGEYHVRFGGHNGYLPEYYDDAPDLDSATAIEVVQGETTSGIDAELYRLMDRVAGVDRIATAIEVSRRAFPGGAPGVVLARADDYADALAGAPLAVVAHGPLLLTSRDHLDVRVRTELERLAPRKVYLLGGAAALAPEVQQEVERTSSDPLVYRLGGRDRYETATEVAFRLEWATDEVRHLEPVVAEGVNSDRNRGWPDAVTASWFAAGELRPVLFVTRDHVPEGTLTYFTRLRRRSATIVGGSAAVSSAVEARIAELVEGEVERIGGDDRYGTSARVAEHAMRRGADPKKVWVATGRDWPDALASGPIVGGQRGVLLLVDGLDPKRQTATVSWLDAHDTVRSLTTVGGLEAVTSVVEQLLFDLVAVPCHPDGCGAP